MNSTHYDVIVLGTGGVGSATLYALAKRGLKVLGLDRFPPGHDRGSSHGESRMIRLSYFEHPNYVPLLRRAYQLWDALDDSLLQRSGVFYTGPEHGEIISGIRLAAKIHHLQIEDYQQALPAGFQTPAGASVLFEAEAGFLPVEQCVKLQLQAALELGAEHRHGAAVLDWQEDAAGITVRTAEEQFSADRLIISAGCWAGTLLSDMGLPLQVLRKHLHWYDASTMEHSSHGFFYELEHGQFYGFPTSGGLIKVGEHSGGEAIGDPLSASREPDPVDSLRIQEFVQQYLPGVGAAQRHEVCFYTMTPDGHFIVDRVPGSQRVAFAAGLSGHGFKFTPVLGEILADLVLEGGSTFDLDFLGLQRPALQGAWTAPR